MKRVNLYFSEVHIERLKILAEKRDVKYSQLVRESIEEYLEKNAKNK